MRHCQAQQHNGEAERLTVNMFNVYQMGPNL